MNVLSLSYKDSKLWQMTLTNLRKKFDMSGTVFWKQSLREIVENSVLKKSLKNICEGVLNKFYKKNKNHIKSHICVYIIHF